MSMAARALSIEGRSIRFSVTRWLLYLFILSFPFFSIQPELFRRDWWVGALLDLAFGLSVLLNGRRWLGSYRGAQGASATSSGAPRGWRGGPPAKLRMGPATRQPPRGGAGPPAARGGEKRNVLDHLVE